MDRRSFLQALAAAAAVGAVPVAILATPSPPPQIRHATDHDDVRNCVRVRYHEPDGALAEVTVTDEESIATYGARWMGIVEAPGSRIDSYQQAVALASACLDDLAHPA